jgi:hypothetical protein
VVQSRDRYAPFGKLWEKRFPRLQLLDDRGLLDNTCAQSIPTMNQTQLQEAEAREQQRATSAALTARFSAQ